MRRLIVNADGYGLAPGVSRAIEECVAFGTVRSVSANVNFEGAEGLRDLLTRFPHISVGCHLNPVVGPPVLPPTRVRSLVDGDGLFHYRDFRARFRQRRIDEGELSAELRAQVARTSLLAGARFTHVDFHMGLHRMPRLYRLFLDVAVESGVGRVRTHRYRAGLVSSPRRLAHWRYVAARPDRLVKYAYNVGLRVPARRRGLAMPDSWVTIDDVVDHPDRISSDSFVRLLANLPAGWHEFVAHPGHVDDELAKWSTYLAPRQRELAMLTTPEVREAFDACGVLPVGYGDMPVG